jgi:LEA14-like dessication related protein
MEKAQDRKRKKRRIWIAAILLVLAGIALFLYLNRRKAMKYVLPEIREFTLIEARIQHDTIYMNVHMVVQNTSPYEMNIDSLNVGLSLDKTKLLSEKRRMKLSLQSGQKDTVAFAAKIPVSKTRGKIESLQGKGKTGLGLHATIVYSVRRLDLSTEQSIDVPIPPQFRIVKTQKKKLSLVKKELQEQLYLEVVNNGDQLNIKIHDLSYEITIGQDLYTKGKYKRAISIKPKSRQLLEFPLDFDMQQPSSTIWKVLTDNDRVPYHLKLKGFIDAGKMKRIPVVIDGYGTLEMDKKK